MKDTVSLRGDDKKESPMDEGIIGAPVIRPDAVDKVRGEAKYVDDLLFTGMLYARVIRSTMPHARLNGLDLSHVEDDPSVVCIVTADDVPGENVVHVVYDDQPALAKEVVRYIGEPIALVAAKDRISAERAAELAKIDYKPLPVVSDPIAALADDAPAVAVPEVVEEGRNVFNHMRLRKGDVEKALRKRM